MAIPCPCCGLRMCPSLRICQVCAGEPMPRYWVAHDPGDVPNCRHYVGEYGAFIRSAAGMNG